MHEILKTLIKYIVFPFYKGVTVGFCVWAYFVYIGSNIDYTKLLSLRNQRWNLGAHYTCRDTLSA